MAFSADELRVLRRALDIALRPDTVSHRPGPARDAEVRDCLRLAEAMAEADHEADRFRAFLLAELARYRAALPGAAPGYARLLRDALEDGYPPGPEDLAALRSLCALPTGATEAGHRRALLRRCEHLAEQTVRTRPETARPATACPATARPAPRTTPAVLGVPATPGVPGARPHPGSEPVHTHPSCALPVRTRLLALPGGRTPHAAEVADPKPGVKPPPPGKPAPTAPPPATPQPKAPPRPDRPIPTPGEVFPPRRKPAPPPGAASGLPAARPA